MDSLKRFSYHAPCHSVPRVCLNSQAVLPLCCLYPPPHFSALLLPALSLSLCWECLFSLSLCHRSSEMSVAEWYSVLSLYSVNPLFKCIEQNLQMCLAYIFSSEFPEMFLIRTYFLCYIYIYIYMFPIKSYLYS